MDRSDILQYFNMSYQPVHDDTTKDLKECEIEMLQDMNASPTFPQSAIAGRPFPNPYSFSYNRSSPEPVISASSTLYPPSDPTSPGADQPLPYNSSWKYALPYTSASPSYQANTQDGDDPFQDEEQEPMNSHKHSQSYDLDDSRSSIQFANAVDYGARNSNPLRQSFASYGSGQSKSESVKSFDGKRASRLLESSKHLTKPVNRSYVVSAFPVSSILELLLAFSKQLDSV